MLSNHPHVPLLGRSVPLIGLSKQFLSLLFDSHPLHLFSFFQCGIFLKMKGSVASDTINTLIQPSQSNKRFGVIASALV